jgi:hypothetical protein
MSLGECRAMIGNIFGAKIKCKTFLTIIKKLQQQKSLKAEHNKVGLEGKCINEVRENQVFAKIIRVSKLSSEPGQYENEKKVCKNGENSDG